MNNEVKTINGYSIKDETARNTKLEHYIVDSSITQSKLQNLLDIERSKVIEFQTGTYNFSNTLRLNKNTTLLLNDSTLNFSVTHGFFNFKDTDEFLNYEGNGDIKIVGGTINSGISFIHAKNLVFEDINFYHVLNDHVFELCALKNVYIKNCTFEGVAIQTEDRNYVECIQLDDCTHDNFPWLNENNPTYDETPNYNINIENCIFKNSDSEDYELYTAIGGHTHIDNVYHKYITIKNNEFYNSKNRAIRLVNSEDVLIDNNLFVNESEDIIPAIALTWYQKDVIISNNNSNYKMFLDNNTRSINLSVINNYIHDIPFVADTESVTHYVIFSQPTTNFIIKDNLFENVYIRILDNRSRPDMTDNEIVIFDNNIIKCNENTEFSLYLLALYGSKKVYLNNNIFDINPTNDVKVFRLHEAVSDVVMKNNLTHRKAYNLQLNGYLGSLSKVFDEKIIVSAFEYNRYSLDDYVIQNYNVFDFNRIAITCGGGTNTQNFVFIPFHYEDKLTARTYKVNCINDSGNSTVISFTINQDGTIDYSVAEGNLAIRQLVLFNE